MGNKLSGSLVKELLISRSEHQGEPDWLRELRLTGLEKYMELGGVSLDEELFAYREDSVINPSLQHLPDQLQMIIHSNTDNRSIIVYDNNTVIYKHLSTELVRQGVIFTTLDSAVRKYPALVRKYFLQERRIKESPERALHTALWSNGIFLFVPENVVIDSPIQVFFIGNEPRLMPHTIIVASEHSSFSYIDIHFSNSQEARSHYNSVSEVYLERGASVEISSNHGFNEFSSDYTERQALIAEDANLEWIISEMNLGDTTANNLFVLEGERARAEVKTIFIGVGDQAGDFESQVVHAAPDTNSNIVFRGIMRDESRAVFDAVTKMDKGASGAETEQSVKVLMLSENARSEANPILLIDEHDVVAGHAASVGPVDPEDIYYLMSRGITSEEAERLIIYGFLAPVVSRMPVEAMKDQLEEMIEGKLV